MVLVYVAHNATQPAAIATQAGSSSSHPVVVPEQEDIWESDIYPAEAWESAAYRSDPPPAPAPAPAPAAAAPAQATQPHRRHRHRPSIDTGGEVWEDDLYSPEAWIYGVEDLDRKNEASVSTTAVPAPTPESQPKRQETHEEVYWPNIERYMSKPTGSRPTVTCVICQTSQLIIPGLQEKDKKETQEEREVLPCGHVVGARCFEEWENVASPPVTCPVCKAVVD